jgi:hypothetical protein
MMVVKVGSADADGIKRTPEKRTAVARSFLNERPIVRN